MTTVLLGSALRALWVVVLLALGFPVQAATPMTLQLKWTHNFQFAGYYAALEKGYYREAGFDVRIEEARPGLDVVGQVVSGQADFGVGNSTLLLDRHAGRPVVVLATIFQHSPAVFIARRQSAAQSVHDLAGQRVMIEPAMAELTRLLTNPRFFRGFVLFETFSDVGKRAVVASVSGARLAAQNVFAAQDTHQGAVKPESRP